MTPESRRYAFEDWYSGNGENQGCIDRDGDGYVDSRADIAWKAVEAVARAEPSAPGSIDGHRPLWLAGLLLLPLVSAAMFGMSSGFRLAISILAANAWIACFLALKGKKS